MDPHPTLSTEIFKFWHLDFQRGRIRIVCQDGRILDEPLEVEVPRDSYIATTTFDWEKWWIMSTTVRGHLIITEGFNPNSLPQLYGRRSVYLDQNRWRAVADALHGSDAGSRGERDAAREIIEMAQDGAIVVPLSIGHLLETSGLYGDRRYEVGLAMSKLAGGWQVRHPIDLWKREAEEAMRKHIGLEDCAPVLHPITTEPGALFDSGTALGVSDETSDHDLFMAMLTMPNVILDLLLEPERAAKSAQSAWVEHHTGVTAQIDAEHLPKDQRRRLARRRYWNENLKFHVDAYRRLTESVGSPTLSDKELTSVLSESPMIGLLSELFVFRFTDRQHKWRTNDLIDMFHLSSAAAYTDYVCAETHTGTQLQAVQRSLGRRINVFTSLEQLVRALRDDGVKTDSERSRQVPDAAKTS